MQASGGEKVVCGFGGFGSGGERIDQLRDLGLVGIADNPGHAGDCGKLFGGALRIASGDDDADGGVGGVKLADGVAGLGVGGGRNGAGIDDDDVGGVGGSGCAAAVQQLALKGGAIGLSGAATELLDEKSRHVGLLH